MKTYVIKLDKFDDSISVRDKMGWAKTGRILLVWPQNGSRLTSKLDLRLIHRHSRSLGSQLAFVTSNPDVRFAANQLSVPVFRTTAQAEKANWRTHQLIDQVRIPHDKIRRNKPTDYRKIRSQIYPQPPTWLTVPIIRLGIFSLGVLALLSIASVLIPQAQIILTPETTTQNIILTIKANPERDDIKISGEIPATIFPVSVEGRKVITATGVGEIPDQFATGAVTFTNLTDQTITIPNGFVLRTIGEEPIRFHTTVSGTILSGSGQMITLTIQALIPGENGNLPEQSLVAIEDISGINLMVNNPSPTSGGSNRSIKSASNDDRRDIYKALKDSLLATAQQELKNQLGEGDLLLSESPAGVRSIEQTYFPEENIPGDQLELNLRLEFQFYVASKEDLYQFASKVADAKLEGNQQAITNTLNVKAVTSPKMVQKNIAEWKIQISRLVRNKIDENMIIRQAIAKNPQQLSGSLFQKLPLKEPPIILVVPSWWPWMPVLPNRIVVSSQ